MNTLVGEPTYQLIQLDSGARLVTAPMLERDSVTVALMLGVGSRYEKDEQAGMAHFIEHIVFKGCEGYPQAQDISQAIEGVGGVLNASTDEEATMFWTKVPKEKLALAVDVLCAMVFRTKLDPAEIAKERQVVVEELRMYKDNPQEYAHSLFTEILWPDHAIGRDVAGTEETVRSFEDQGCRQFLHEHYWPQNLVISIAGAVDPEQARSLVESRIGSWADSSPSTRFPFAPVGQVGSSSERFRVVSKDIEQANIILGLHSVSYMDESRFAGDILNTILGEGMSSRLFVNLRENLSLAYDIHSFTIRHHDVGALGMFIGCEPARAEAAVGAAISELHQLIDEPVDGAELNRAKEYLKGRLRLQLESTSAWGNYLGEQELLTGEILSPAEIISRLDKVTAIDVQNAACQNAKLGLWGVLVGPFAGQREVNDLLNTKLV